MKLKWNNSLESSYNAKLPPDMRSLFIEWYEENYPRTTVHKDKFEDYLKIAHKDENDVTTSLEGTKEKQRTVWGKFLQMLLLTQF